jgi:hypothetical protein
MCFDDDLDDWMAFEAINVAYGDHLLCPACDIGILTDDGSACNNHDGE